jgi:hypothetical protein
MRASELLVLARRLPPAITAASLPQHRRHLLNTPDARVHFHRLVEAVGVGFRVAAPAALAYGD